MKPALLLVDLQGDFLATPGLQPPAGALVDRTARLLDCCRDRRIPILHIWTTIHRDHDQRLPHWRQADRWMCVAGTPGHQPPARLRPLDGEVLVHKAGFNAFASGELDAALRRLGCDTVILAGLHLHACVRTTTVECLERGYQVLVAEDAVASNDPIHAAATRRWLTERCVGFATTATILGSPNGGAPPTWTHRSPRRTHEVLFEVPITAARGIATATAAAQNAGIGWRRTSRSARLRLLEEVAHRLDAAAPDLARQMAIEIGKPLAHGREELRRGADNVRDAARRAGSQAPQRRQAAGLVRDRPLGVVAVIPAWNNPVAIPLGKIAPALAYGNTVVWKPAPAATRVAEVLLRLLHESGVPADAVCLVTGDHTTAQRLAADEHVDAVTFTGSLLAGYAMQEICARRLVPLQAELSGNNASIVWDDADLVQAAAQVAWGAFAFAGQRCTANRRVIVSRSRFEACLQELKQASDRLAWGDPLEEATEIGPVISLAKRAEVAAMISRAQSGGHADRVVFLQDARAEQPWTQAGAYAQPTIVCCDQPDQPVVQEETMAPLLVVQRAEDFQHALALSNGVRHGLIASLFSPSPDRQRQFLEEARAGVLKLNESTAGVDTSLPFGGWKASGLGPPEHGEGDRLFYTRLQAVYGAAEVGIEEHPAAE
jgi:acyl-CoA reductase-like NAD-dependent aldehyde dehydrogenase